MLEVKSMRKKINKSGIFLALFLLLFLSSSLNADNGDGTFKIGIAASLQDQQLDIMVPLWLENDVVISPSVYVIHLNGISSDIGIGFGARKNFPRGDAYPYVGAHLGALISMPEESSTMTDFIGGPMAGGEYLFNDNFGAGVEAQLNITKSHERSMRFGNPDKINVNTATYVYVTFYFK
jgi:hypothetical protein